MQYKICFKCNEVKILSEFYKNRNYILKYCKKCHHVLCKEYYHKTRKKPIVPNDDYNSLPDEIWKDIEGYENIYQISNFGRVKSLRTFKIIKQRKSISGYLNVTLRKETTSKLKGMRVNRLVALAFVSNPNNKPYVNHINAIKTDNNFINLEWCTQSENIKHAYKIGTKKPSNQYLKNDMERKISKGA
jgi:hypothetical protein